MLSFVFESGSLQFEINLAAANAAHLRVSSRLLALARRVLNNPESSVGDDTAGNTSRKVG
jgi:YfiR/HmsC-like